jgi:hypothetical protein
MQPAARGSRRVRNCASAAGPAVAAFLGAAATFVALLGIVAVAASPRSLSDDGRLPTSAESFEVSPAAAPELATDVYAVAPATGQYEEPGLQSSLEVHARQGEGHGMTADLMPVEFAAAA